MSNDDSVEAYLSSTCRQCRRQTLDLFAFNTFALVSWQRWCLCVDTVPDDWMGYQCTNIDFVATEIDHHFCYASKQHFHFQFGSFGSIRSKTFKTCEFWPKRCRSINTFSHSFVRLVARLACLVFFVLFFVLNNSVRNNYSFAFLNQHIRSHRHRTNKVIHSIVSSMANENRLFCVPAIVVTIVAWNVSIFALIWFTHLVCSLIFLIAGTATVVGILGLCHQHATGLSSSYNRYYSILSMG